MTTEQQPYALLVDDDECVHYLTTRLLDKLGYAGDKRAARCGRSAIEIIERHGEPGLVLLDIRMPGMDGFEFLEHVADTLGASAPPVVMLSSSVLEEDRERALAYPFVRAFCEKPMRRDDLRGLVTDDPVLAALFTQITPAP